MGGYLKGVWVELGHMVCGVHQAHDVPCGTVGAKSHGGLSSWDIIPTRMSKESKNSKFEFDLLQSITSLLSR